MATGPDWLAPKASKEFIKISDALIMDKAGKVALATDEVSSKILSDSNAHKLNPEIVLRLSKTTVGPIVFVITKEWLTIAAAMYLTYSTMNIWVYALALLVISSLQHALAILTHDASHFRFTKSRLANDLISNIFCAWPLLFSVEGYRSNHWVHHQHVNTEDDPDLQRKIGSKDWTFPKPKLALFFILLKDCLLLNAHEAIGFAWRSFSRASKAGQKGKNMIYAQYLFYALLVTSMFFSKDFCLIFALLWLVPLFSTTKAFLRMRSIAEHLATENFNIYNRTRTVICNPVEGWLIAPCSVNYHLEHHLYPSVPFYNLKELHHELMKNADYRGQAHISYGYWGLVNELASFAPEKANPIGTSQKVS